MDLFRHKIFVNGSQIKKPTSINLHAIFKLGGKSIDVETAPCKSIDQHVCNYQFKI